LAQVADLNASTPSGAAIFTKTEYHENVLFDRGRIEEMFSKSDFLPPELRAWLAEVTPGEPDILRRLRQETSRFPAPQMQIPPEQGPFLALLARATGARKTLEIGVFTGYSALAVALALPEGARITALDVSEEYTAVARRYWAEAGVAHKIDLRIAPAVQSLEKLIGEGAEGAYDFAFVDADKTNVDSYYEYCLRLLSPGGLIAIDNIFQHCRVLDQSNQDPDVVAMRRLSEKLRDDERVIVSVLPFADGVTLALKK
jgi:predicted O-methyltransferase YrrM